VISPEAVKAFWTKVLGLSLLGWVSALGAAPRTGISVFDFAATGTWSGARVTDLEEAELLVPILSNRGQIRKHFYRMTEVRNISGGDLVVNDQAVPGPNLYQQLQDLSLREMRRRGMISQTLYEDVLYARDIWQPSQIRFGVDWIEMSFREAENFYKGQIPWSRVLGGPIRFFVDNMEKWPDAPPDAWKALWKPDEKLRIVRASIMVGHGQALNFQSGEYERLRLSWEHYPSPSERAFRSRDKLPLTAEFSRALSTDGVSGGSLTEPIRVLLSILETESALAGADPKQYLIFGHALDRPHARRYAQSFEMRPFTDEMRESLEQGMFPSEAFGSPQPELEKTDRSVLVTTLAKVVSDLITTANLSAYDLRRRPYCQEIPHGTLAARRASYEGVFSHLSFPLVPLQQGPVCFTDHSPVGVMKLAQLAYDNDLSDANATGLSRANGRLNWDPNFNAPYWSVPSYIHYDSRMKTPGPPSLGTLRVDNLSEAAVVADPMFLERVIASAYAGLREKILALPPPLVPTFLSVVTQVYYLNGAEGQLPDFRNVDDILSRFTFVFVTASEQIRDELVRRGGIVVNSTGVGNADAFRLNVVNGQPMVDGSKWIANGYLVFLPFSKITKTATPTTVRCDRKIIDFILLQAAAQL
jgi:hypothetical protein